MARPCRNVDERFRFVILSNVHIMLLLLIVLAFTVIYAQCMGCLNMFTTQLETLYHEAW